MLVGLFDSPDSQLELKPISKMSEEHGREYRKLQKAITTGRNSFDWGMTDYYDTPESVDFLRMNGYATDDKYFELGYAMESEETE